VKQCFHEVFVRSKCIEQVYERFDSCDTRNEDWRGLRVRILGGYILLSFVRECNEAIVDGYCTPPPTSSLIF